MDPIVFDVPIFRSRRGNYSPLHLPHNIAIDHNDAMKMIGHYGMFIQYDIGKMLWYFIPTFFNHYSRIIQHHFTFYNVTKQTCAVLCA